MHWTVYRVIQVQAHCVLGLNDIELNAHTASSTIRSITDLSHISSSDYKQIWFQVEGALDKK